jgi:glycosyltransferase involved in cell wall biosynthesis
MVFDQRKLGIDAEVLYYTYLRKIKLHPIDETEHKYVYSSKSKNIIYDSMFLIKQRMNYVLNEITKIDIDFASYQVYHAHKLFTDGYLAYKLSLRYSKKYIVTIRNTDINKKLYWKFKMYSKTAFLILDNASKIIFISPTAISRFRELIGNRFTDYESKIQLIPNGIDDFWFNANQQRRKIDMNNLNILTIGDINKNKNIHNVAKAISLIKSEFKNIEYIVAGKIIDHKYYNKLKQYEFLKYVGFLDKIEIRKLMDKSDIFILVSISETFGLVYAESLSVGLPIIYTKNQGFDKFYTDGYIGYSSDPKSPKDISTKILEVLRNYNSISTNIVNVKPMFKWSEINNLLIDIYLNV